MPTSKKPHAKGEITYHVGWKKGTITLKDSDPTAPISHNESVYLSFIWRPAAFLPAALDIYLICALPVLSFTAILTLVYLLNH